MSEINLNFKVDLNDVETLKKLERIFGELGSTIDIEKNNDDSESKSKGNIEMLVRFYKSASENQKKVLNWMIQNPGEISAAILKKEMIFLAPHGALSGVFQKGRWTNHLNGNAEDCPFYQVAWDRENGCGVYRGITIEEASALKIEKL